MVLNRSPKFCLKLTYKYLLKAYHVPGDTWGGAIYGPREILEQTLLGKLGDATYQISKL